MSEFQSVRSSSPGQGLFTPEEVELLMRVEFERAQRHKYPVVCMLVAVDRLAQLQDLYGWESKDEIRRAVVGLMRASTRESDLLGWLTDDRLLVLFPHTSPEVAAMLSRRVLSGAKKMRFERDGKRLSISLSIGVADNHREGTLSFETLVGVAQEGLAVAEAGGGDRFVETDQYQALERKRAKQPAKGKPGKLLTDVPPAPFGEEETAMGGLPPQAAPDPAALEKVLHLLQEEREIPAGGDLAEARRRIDVLERRILKLTQLLGLTEEELKRVAAMKGIDLGVASIYRSVQGLSTDAAERERKREMMKEIFKANLELQKELQRQKGTDAA